MKITIEYQVDRQDLEDLDYQDAICALHGRKYLQLIVDYLHILRNTRKYKILSEAEGEFVASAEELLYSLADEAGIGEHLSYTTSSEVDTLQLTASDEPTNCF